MVRMTNVPNTIRVPTNRVDLWHHGLQIGERTPKTPMEPPQGEERKRKKERRKKEKEEPVPYFAQKSRQAIWRDCFMCRARTYGAAGLT
jgi:hypothetical protein